jgi:hypothetical protein
MVPAIAKTARSTFTANLLVTGPNPTLRRRPAAALDYIF